MSSDQEAELPTPEVLMPDEEVDVHAHLTMDTVDRDAVGKVAGCIELTDIRAVTLSAVISPHFGLYEQVPATWTEHVVIGFDTHTLEGKSPDRLRVMALFFAHFDRDWIDIDPDDITEPPEDRPPDIEIEARYILEYKIDEDAELDAEELRHFGYFNGSFQAWPYWREYAQEASARLGLAPRLVVPVFRVPRV